MVYNAAPDERRRRKFCERSRHDQVVYVAGGRACDVAKPSKSTADMVLQKIIQLKILARREDRKNLRRHVKHATCNDREAGDGEVKAITTAATGKHRGKIINA